MFYKNRNGLGGVFSFVPTVSYHNNTQNPEYDQ